ncbi:unnamed protein product [Nippostrongylus brasiliensis]|uniref:Gut granule loss protein 3 (inferred by orthology to a C. elegans protein) n=1 Tax=Nippostrongylus brasiliensis TaxID=27835 RepID=A0A0N4YFY2_NIPBR|nr:unnamed protein product [Nippostrongylus brasiliensis]
MFGYILVSNSNQVLFYGGDSGFDSYLEDRLKAEQPCSPRTPSTSSGICSDSSTESFEKIQRQFLDYVTLGLDIKIGPLLSQIDSDPTSAATATDFLKSLCGLFPSFLDVRKAAFFQQESETTQPLLQKLAHSLKDDLGLNRLLLVSGHDVLVSATSAKDDENFLANLASTDLNFVLREISSLDCLEQGKIFQSSARYGKYSGGNFEALPSSSSKQHLKKEIVEKFRHES